MPSEKKTIKFKTGRLPRRILDKLRNLIEDLYEVKPDEFLPLEAGYSCFDELCVIYSRDVESTQQVNVTKIFTGNWLALYYKSKRVLAPSIPLVSEVYRKYGVKAAVVVAEMGVKAFLYGNDILPESVVHVIPPRKGLYAVIDHFDGEILGFARWNPSKQVYENVYDIGIFLRFLG